MPDAITFDQAAALAQRLDHARERGAVLLLDGVQQIIQFRFHPEENQIVMHLFNGWWCNFCNRETCTPDEFERYWQGRITVTYPGPWPTGERVTWGTLRDALMETEAHFMEAGYRHARGEAKERTVALGTVAESAQRLAHLCRELAAETGE